jgi:hypothetical protein
VVATYFKRGSATRPDAGGKGDGAQSVCNASRPPDGPRDTATFGSHLRRRAACLQTNDGSQTSQGRKVVVRFFAVVVAGRRG